MSCLRRHRKNRLTQPLFWPLRIAYTVVLRYNDIRDMTKEFRIPSETTTSFLVTRYSEPFAKSQRLRYIEGRL